MRLHVEVVCAWPGRSISLKITVEEGCTVGKAITESGLLDLLPQPVELTGHVGIFGKLVTPNHRVGDGDRIEIYRPLVADPKESRRARALKR
jgi:putative ubiquitin-RnfH superfamily antitoxin RatB of RatAB toxin-antitoxin module